MEPMDVEEERACLSDSNHVMRVGGAYKICNICKMQPHAHEQGVDYGPTLK